MMKMIIVIFMAKIIEYVYDLFFKKCCNELERQFCRMSTCFVLRRPKFHSNTASNDS